MRISTKLFLVAAVMGVIFAALLVLFTIGIPAGEVLR